MGSPENNNNREQFLEKLKNSANDSKALLSLGKSCFLSECYDDAIEAYKRIISLNNSNDTAYYNLGVAYHALGKYIEAKRAFLNTLELNPNHQAAQEALNILTDY